MPIIKSAIKRARQQASRRSHNLQVKRAVHRDTRAVLDAIAAGDSAAVAEKLKEAQSEIDRAVKKGTLHRNTAARQKSRLVKQASVLLTEAPKPAKPKAAAKKPAAAKPAAKKPAAKKTATK